MVDVTRGCFKELLVDLMCEWETKKMYLRVGFNGENANHIIKLQADKRPQYATAREARIFMQTVGRGKQVDPAEEERLKKEQRFKRLMCSLTLEVYIRPNVNEITLETVIFLTQQEE